MSSPPNVDREAILARRALFMSTALAGLACTSASVSKPESDASSQLAEAGEARSVPAGEGGEAGEPDDAPPVVRPWSELMAGMPPLDLPEGLPAREHQHLSGQVRVIEAEYDKLRKMWEAVPDCAATDEGCTGWGELSEQLEPYHREPYAFGCDPETNGTTGSVTARRGAHSRFQQGLLQQLEQRAAGSAARHGKASADAWSRMAARGAAMPMPCLSACEQPMQVDILVQISFAPGSSALAFEDPAKNVQFMLSQAQAQASNNFARLIVRGHADPSEAEPEALAQQRAEAVVAWLVEAGIDAATLEAVNFGARLRVESGEAGLEHNPRVDFEVVTKQLGR